VKARAVKVVGMSDLALSDPGKILLPRSRVECFEWSLNESSTSYHAQVCVFIFAFLGATRRQMRYYANTYINILKNRRIPSFRVYCCFPTVAMVFKAGLSSDPHLNGYGDLIEDVEDVLRAKLNPSCKILLKFCSNGGGFAFEAIVKKTAESELSNFWSSGRVVGCIFDSAPVDITTSAIHNASVQSLGKLCGEAAYLTFSFIAGDGNKRREEFSSCFEPARFTPIPRLFLYSRADKIADARLIKELLQKHDAHGYDFMVSGHVSHNSLFNKIYCDQIEQYLDKLALYIFRSNL